MNSRGSTERIAVDFETVNSEWLKRLVLPLSWAPSHSIANLVTLLGHGDTRGSHVDGWRVFQGR